jgi:hypothetical protein
MANYNISNYNGRVFLIGDVHGDVRAVVRALALTGCVHVPQSVLDSADVCHSGEAAHIGSDNVVYPVGVKLNPIGSIKDIKWKANCKHVVTFLGDILDNRGRDRSNPSPPNGECGTAGGEIQILDILLKLFMEAKKQGGRLLWVLGNHDIANVANTEPTFCRAFAPQQYVKNGAIRETCDGNKFSTGYMEHLRYYMDIMQPVAIARFHNGGDTAFIACHGGIDCGVFDIYGDTRKNILIPGAVNANIKFVNALYDVGVTRTHVDDHLIRKICRSIPKIIPGLSMMVPCVDAARQCAIAMITSDKTRPRMPHWCRPKKMTKRSTYDLAIYFGAGIIMKGHDVKSRVHCLRGDRDVPSDSVLRPGTVCFTDIAMGRSFWAGYKDPKPPIHVICVASLKGKLMMKIM